MERLFGALLGAMELATVHLGSQLGLYAALDRPLTADELASGDRDRRPLRPGVAGAAGDQRPGRRGASRVTPTPSLRHQPGTAAGLADSESPVYAASMALLLGGIGTVLPGCPRPTAPDRHQLRRVRRRRPPRPGAVQPRSLPRPAHPGVAAGHAGGGAQLLARDGAAAARPRLRSRLVGHRARPGPPRPHGARHRQRRRVGAWTRGANAAEAGLEDRVRFEVVAADEDLGRGRLRRGLLLRGAARHGPPRRVARRDPRSLRPGGRVVVMDERAEEQFAPGGSEIERLLAASACCTACRSAGPSRARRRRARCSGRTTMRRYAAAGGVLARRGRTHRARPVPLLRAHALSTSAIAATCSWSVPQQPPTTRRSGSVRRSSP